MTNPNHYKIHLVITCNVNVFMDITHNDKIG